MLHCPKVFGPSVAAFVGENNNGSDANESLEMTMLSPSRPRRADAKLERSERVVVEDESDMASVLEDGGWNRVRLISSAMVGRELISMSMPMQCNEFERSGTKFCLDLWGKPDARYHQVTYEMHAILVMHIPSYQCGCAA